MFAGVTSILLNEEEQIISGISSKEGEEVKLAAHTYTCLPNSCLSARSGDYGAYHAYHVHVSTSQVQIRPYNPRYLTQPINERLRCMRESVGYIIGRF
jgi:hypothetical protein